MEGIAKIDLAEFTKDAASRQAREDCRLVAEAFGDVGVLCVRDPRSRALDFEPALHAQSIRYFHRPDENKRLDERRDRHRQAGWTPPGEAPRERTEIRSRFAFEEQPLPYAEQDLKQRFSIPIGPPPPSSTRFPVYNRKDPVIPVGFEDWISLGRIWGEGVLRTVMTATEMAAIGFGCHDPKLFPRLLEYGPHLFAPTYCDLNVHGAPGTVLAGFHEIGIYPETVSEMEEVRRAGGELRRSAVLAFFHRPSDAILQPHDRFDTPEARAKYASQRMLAGERMSRHLERSGLKVE